MGKMSAEQKLIEEISRRKYEVDGPFGHETVTPDDFTLKISDVIFLSEYTFVYELFRKREFLDTRIIWDYHRKKWWPILEFDDPAEVKRRYKKKAKFFLKQVVRKENLKSYLPDALIDDIVELFFIKGDIKHYY